MHIGVRYIISHNGKWVAIRRVVFRPCISEYSRTFEEGANTPAVLSGRRQGECRPLTSFCGSTVDKRLSGITDHSRTAVPLPLASAEALSADPRPKLD